MRKAEVAEEDALVFELDDGVKLGYRLGEGHGLCCVLLHGLGDGGFIWSEILDELGGTFRTLTIDLRGHGRSSWDPHGQYDLDKFTKDVESLLIEIGFKEPVLIGHSLGGNVVMRLIQRRTIPFRGAILIDSGPFDRRADIAQIARNVREGCIGYKSLEEAFCWLQSVRPLATAGYLRRILNEVVELRDGQFVARFDPRVVNILDRPLHDEWWWSALRTARPPLLMMRGEASSVLSDVTARRMLAQVREGQLKVIPNAGHSIMIDNPVVFRSVVLSFLDRLG